MEKIQSDTTIQQRKIDAEKEKTAGIDVKMLEEKLAVQELEEKIGAKRAVVERLESKKRNLENRST